MRDELPIKPRLNECGILNLNNSTQDGSHWVAWKKIKNKKIYFDSFGMPPPPELVKYLDKMILAKELHKPVRKKFPKRRIFTKGIDDLWAADLVIMRNYSDENKELKKKDGINVSEAFEKIIKQAISQNHQAPKLLHADKEKSSIIERFNRTLNSKMRLHFEVTNSKKWIKILKSLIYKYNFKDIHRSIGMRPCEVNKSNEDVVFHKLFSTKNKPKLKIKFSVGDRVRITASKKTFGNKYSKNWTKEIFIVNEILNTNPITYKIIDLNNEEIEGKNINNNKMNKKFTYPPKTCDKCNLTVGCKNWAAHLKSIRHQKNDIDQTIVPFRFNKTYKGIPINQEKQKNYNYLKLMQNDIKKSIQKTKCYVKFCAFEYYENSESVKYTLNKIPIEGNIFIIKLCKIANEQIIATGDYTHHFLEDIKFIQDLGNIKIINKIEPLVKGNIIYNKMDNKTCDKCNLTVSYKNWSRHLKSIRHQNNDPDQTIKPKFNKTYKVFNFSAKMFEKNNTIRPILKTDETAFQSRLKTYVIKNNMAIKDVQVFLNRLDNPVIGQLKHALKKKNLKVNIMFLAIYKREFVMKNSQWRLHQILSLGININKYVPFKGSSYIPLPKHIGDKKAIINVQNKDDKCFLRAILSALHPVEKNPQRDLWKLCGSQMTKDGHKRFLCKMCLSSFDDEYKLNDHKHYCVNNKAAKIVLPEAYNKTLEFQNYNHSLRVPFVVYADFECTLKPIYTCQPNDTESFTTCYQKHIPNNFCYYIKYSNGDYKPPVVYSGPNVAQQFYECMKNEEILISKMYDKIVPMKTLNAEQLNNYYNKSDKCHICERYLSDLPPILEKKFKIIKGVIEYYKQFKIVEDDDAKKIKKIKGVIEYYKKFKMVEDDDSKKLKLYEDKLKNEIENKNKNMRKVRDHDHLTGEYRGAAHSIYKLTNNLRNDSKLNLRNKFKELSKYFPEEHLDLVTRKLAYPYEYMDCEEKFNETCLPPIEKFYSSLTNKNITKEEYENSQKIWKVFNIQNMREFTSLYNKIDVLLSTDIIENFRDISLKNYKLDPMWYYTTPGFAWDCMLRMTNIKLDLLTDIDQILIFESGIQCLSGLSQCSQRYSKANNKYMGDKFKKKEESIFLQYLDANNLYGWAMSKYLPTGDFKWVDNVNNFDVMNISDKSCKGYILEVDLSYPKELHDIHSDFPLAPERHFDNKQLPKLLTTLYDKKKYIIHYETLKLYINLGLKIEKIHRVLEFSQSPWLKSYIDFNTNLRSEAKNEFEKEYFKLMNNSVYGRTMMNVRNHVNIRLCSNGSTVEKLITKPNFDRRTIFTENLAAVHMKRTQISFKQPIYIGMCVLDLSKMLMYDFYYNIIKKKYGNRVRLLYTDTDSLILEIKTNDFYQDIKINLDHFDTSDYPKDNIYGLPLVNKKVLGKFKDELNGKIMTEFIGLRSKLYSHRHRY
ncbi:hypothetical protein QTP88_020445 [Uroleucon formosanum]